MANIPLIQAKLPQELRTEAQKYTIGDKFLTEISDVVVLLLKSKTIDKFEDKQNWFSLMPLMNAEQLAKLKEILVKEKTKLEEIEQKYEQKKVDIQQKYLTKWQSMGYVKKIEAVKKQEAVQQQSDVNAAEALLQGI